MRHRTTIVSRAAVFGDDVFGNDVFGNEVFGNEVFFLGIGDDSFLIETPRDSAGV